MSIPTEGITHAPWGSPSISFNRQPLSSNRYLLSQVVEQFIYFLPDNLSILVGIGNGGTTIARAITKETNLACIILSKVNNRLIRPDCLSEYPNKSICLVDDTLCRGTRALEARRILNPHNTLISVLCVVFWNDNSYLNRLTGEGLKVISLFSGEELNSLGRKMTG